MNSDFSWSADERRATAGLYRLLARLWLREVDPTLVDLLNQNPIRAAFFPTACGKTSPLIDAAMLEMLSVDFCRLFVGPQGHRIPSQSVWEHGMLESETTVSMRQWIDLVSYPSRVDGGNVPHDHLAIQLDVMAHILGQDDLWQTHPDELESLAATYHATHLSWPLPLLEEVESRAETSLYRQLARVTRDALRPSDTDGHGFLLRG